MFKRKIFKEEILKRRIFFPMLLDMTHCFLCINLARMGWGLFLDNDRGINLASERKILANSGHPLCQGLF